MTNACLHKVAGVVERTTSVLEVHGVLPVLFGVGVDAAILTVNRATVVVPNALLALLERRVNGDLLSTEVLGGVKNPLLRHVIPSLSV